MTNEEEKYAQFKQAYDSLKEDGGRLKVAHIGKLLRSLKYDPTEKELNDYIKEADPEKTGYTDWTQFQAMAHKLRNPFTKEEIAEAFAYLDTNKDKKISWDEFKRIMTTQGDKFTDEEADEIFQEIDRDSNGFIEYDELLNKLYKGD